MHNEEHKNIEESQEEEILVYLGNGEVMKFRCVIGRIFPPVVIPKYEIVKVGIQHFRGEKHVRFLPLISRIMCDGEAECSIPSEYVCIIRRKRKGKWESFMLVDGILGGKMFRNITLLLGIDRSFPSERGGIVRTIIDIFNSDELEILFSEDMDPAFAMQRPYDFT